MYFVKSKKPGEQPDGAKDERDRRRDRYNRSESGRLLLQAMPQSQQSKVEPAPGGEAGQARLSSGELAGIPGQAAGRSSGSARSSSEFHPDELPDGACHRPNNKDLTNIITNGSNPNNNNNNNSGGGGRVSGGGVVHPGVGMVQGGSRRNSGNSNDGAGVGSAISDVDSKTDLMGKSKQQRVSSGVGGGMEEQIRYAKYVGTFTVSGSDKAARERQMEEQLTELRSATDTRPVRLHISCSGVKVMEDGQVFMDHSLKRIWYATCDPDSRQFSFLAREPKTSAEVQYCHAFTTGTAGEAEELISIIGQAFKSSSPSSTQEGDPHTSGHTGTHTDTRTDTRTDTHTDTQPDIQPDLQPAVEPEQPPPQARQPTFHEIIEQQVQQQQAKFRVQEEEANAALQAKLQQIATPTPFSGAAQHRMEQRRQSEEEGSPGGRLWAKDQVERRRVTHTSPDHVGGSQASLAQQAPPPSHRRSEIPTRGPPHAQVSPLKRNSVPPQMPVQASPPPHPLSALAIKEHLESKASSGKFKD